MIPETTTAGLVSARPATTSSAHHGADPLSLEPTRGGALGLAMVVRWVDTTTGRARRRVYVTTPAAEAAVRRADALGQRVEVQLVELRPVGDGFVDLLADHDGGR